MAAQSLLTPPRGLVGVNTALVTPMHADGSLDLAALDALVERQLEAQVASLTALGTTGEAATLTEAEKRQVMRQVVRRVDGRVPILVGTGAQGTQATIEAQRVAMGEGATYGLVVTPFYNKPPAQGMVRHFEAVADATELPVVLYNVPSRTAVDLKPESILTLAKHPNIIGVKEATADLGRLDELVGHAPADFALLSGDDAITCAFCLMGGHGVISVTSNVVPGAMVEMVRHAHAGKVAQARQVHQQMVELIGALFTAPNPIPVKAALALLGHMQGGLRAPLCSLAEKQLPRLERALGQVGLVKKA